MNIADLPRYKALREELRLKGEYELLGKIIDLMEEVMKHCCRDILKIIKEEKITA